MRIISGSLKSRKITFPKTKMTRPMTDKMKETVFNIIGGLLPGKHLLDLYAGSGSLGLEGLSRGAMHAVFVDQSPTSSRTIQRNLQDLDLIKRGQVIQSDVLRALDKFKKKGQMFSLIFVDPPYNKGLVKKTLMRLDQSGIVLPFGQVVLGHSAQEPIPEGLEKLRLTRSQKIGQSYVSFLFRLESDHGETKSYLSGEF